MEFWDRFALLGRYWGSPAPILIFLIILIILVLELVKIPSTSHLFMLYVLSYGGQVDELGPLQVLDLLERVLGVELCCETLLHRYAYWRMS